MKTKAASSELYWEVHRGNGPYLLMVHGFLSSRAQWLRNIEVLSETVTPVVVELLGHGRSQCPESPGAYHPDEYVKAFENIRRRLNSDVWFICGHSLGACLTMRYALTHPDRIKAQILTNTVAGFATANDASEQKRLVEETAAMIFEQGHEFLEKLPMHPANARFLPKDVKAALVADCSRVKLSGVVGAMRGTMPAATVRDEVNRNTVPALLVCGRMEKRFTVFRDFAQANMPHLDILDLDAGHAVNVGAADEFNAAVSAFIQKHNP